MKIDEIKNNLPTTKPLKEIMSLNVPNVNTSLPYKNEVFYYNLNDSFFFVQSNPII